MKKNNVVVWGTEKISEVISFYLENDSEYEISAYCVDREYKKDDYFNGKPIVCFDEIELMYPPLEYFMCIPMSYKNMNNIRTQKYMEAKKKGYNFITYISSKAVYYNTPVGENTIILENNIIQPFTTIGNNVIMWCGSVLAHHSKIEDNCFIASHVTISGCACIKKNSFIGANANIRDRVLIGENNLIGAGVTILQDTADYEVYACKDKYIQIPQKSVNITDI